MAERKTFMGRVCRDPEPSTIDYYDLGARGKPYEVVVFLHSDESRAQYAKGVLPRRTAYVRKMRFQATWDWKRSASSVEAVLRVLAENATRAKRAAISVCRNREGWSICPPRSEIDGGAE